VVETDLYGYYDRKLLEYYPKPREWQYRDEYPVEDSFFLALDFQANDWEKVDDNDTIINEKDIKTPETFKKEIEELKQKYKIAKPNMWENRH
jgi:hypothetical protein